MQRTELEPSWTATSGAYDFESSWTTILRASATIQPSLDHCHGYRAHQCNMEGQSGSNNSSDFVRKLYKMLESPQDESVVRWGNEGDSFVVLENEKFSKEAHTRETLRSLSKHIDGSWLLCST